MVCPLTFVHVCIDTFETLSDLPVTCPIILMDLSRFFNWFRDGRPLHSNVAVKWTGTPRAC